MVALTATTARLAFAAKLTESGLTAADAARLQLTLLTPRQTRALSSAFLEAWSIKLPYHDLGGKIDGFYRLRYLGDPRPTTGFAARTTEKIPRYVQAPDTEPHVYLPLLSTKTPYGWTEVLKNTAQPLLITEGELKAACATVRSFPTLGLGGVWSWRSARRGIQFIEPLASASWEARRVYIVFDSDTATNPDVQRALQALCVELTRRGALPFTVRLPQLAGLTKTGLDDFLVHSSNTDLHKLLTEAQTYGEARELWALNSSVTYIRSPGVIVELATRELIQPQAFMTHRYANRFYTVTTVTPAGNPKTEEKPLAPAWVRWPFRAELARITYAPGQPTIISDDSYNFWRGWGCPAVKGDVSPWRELLDFLFTGEPAARTWFERWCAYPVRHPGTKLYTAAVMWGAMTGTGKSLVGYSLMRVYGDNSGEINDQHLQSDFNEWAVNQQFVMGDDVVSGENKRHVADRLKALITQQEMRVNQKYMPSYVVPDCINYYFTSNHPDAFFIEDADRRYFVHEAPTTRLPVEFYRNYDRWLRSSAGPAALRAHLEALDLSGFDPRAEALETRSKHEMITDNKTELAAWVHRLRTQTDEVLRRAGPAYDSDLFTTTQLGAIYDPESTKRTSAALLYRELKRAGFKRAWTGTVMTRSGAQRLWIIRNVERWIAVQSPRSIAAYWDARFPRFEPSATKKY